MKIQGLGGIGFLIDFVLGSSLDPLPPLSLHKSYHT